MSLGKSTEKVKRKLKSAASKNARDDHGQNHPRRKTEILLINVVTKQRDRRWSWLGHALHMPEHRLVRQVLVNCVKLTHDTIFADVPNLSIENVTKTT